MSDVMTKSMARNVFYGGSLFFIAIFGAMSVHSHLYAVNVSTDKAANPSCVLGYSKRITERLTASFAEPPPASEDLIAHLMPVLGSITDANGETPSTSPSLPPAKT